MFQVWSPKHEAKKPEWPRCARPETVIIKPVEGMSYPAILKSIKSSVPFKGSPAGYTGGRCPVDAPAALLVYLIVYIINYRY